MIVVFLLSAAWWPLPTATLTCAMLAAPAHGADILPACTLGSKYFPRTFPKAFNFRRSLGLQEKYVTAISSEITGEDFNIEAFSLVLGESYADTWLQDTIYWTV